jgi:purine-nucleoside phosphorylase
MLKEIKNTADFLKSKINISPKIGMITGTGLGSLTQKMNIEFQLPYEDIPNFPQSTIEGHKGNLVCGVLSDKPLLALEGRFHIYEGYSPQEITFPVRVMAEIGIECLLISSAAGGLNPLFQKGDLMLVTDHINLTGTNPLIGQNLDSFGPRFPDMSQVYDPKYLMLTEKSALKSGISLKQGVYVGLTGPSLETRAETRMLKMLGADAVGMSTVSEAIVGVHCGLKIIAVVVITNVNLPDCMEETSIEDVIKVAEEAGSNLSLLWEETVKGLRF